MSSLIARLSPGQARRLPMGWVPAAIFLLAAVIAAPAVGPSVRAVFVIGCGVLGWTLWRRGPEAHLQAALILFAFAPLVRRLVDLVHGYDPVGLMLVGPLLAIAAPLPDLFFLPARTLRAGPSLLSAAFIVTAGSAAYAASLSFFQGDLTNAASGALKWGAPLIYGAVLHRRASIDPDQLVRAAASGFVIILPLIGLYGIFQYVDPPAWDRLWLQYAPITSAGLPRPFAVRTFGTLNSPASFATFASVGILLVCFLRPAWQAFVLGAPSVVALLLSSYRTAWLSLGMSVLFALLFRETRTKALSIVCGSVAALLVVGTVPPIGQTIYDRISTFERVTEDDSGRERMEQFSMLWNQPNTTRALFGTGFTAASDGSASQMAVDGMIVGCWVTMGFTVGLLCVLALISAGAHMIRAALRNPTAANILLGALGCGALVQLPLANIASGELGFLFWTFAALAVTVRPGRKTGLRAERPATEYGASRLRERASLPA